MSMTTPEDQEQTCYCDTPDHEICWDDEPNLDCSCCVTTAEDMGYDFEGAED